MYLYLNYSKVATSQVICFIFCNKLAELGSIIINLLIFYEVKLIIKTYLFFTYQKVLKFRFTLLILDKFVKLLFGNLFTFISGKFNLLTLLDWGKLLEIVKTLS